MGYIAALNAIGMGSFAVGVLSVAKMGHLLSERGPLYALVIGGAFATISIWGLGL